MGLATLFSGTRSTNAQVFNPAAYPSRGVLSVGGQGFTIDTDALTYNGIPGGILVGNVAVFDFDSISIGSGAAVAVTGSHPLALLSRGAFVLAQGATVYANAGGYGSGNGPGAGPSGVFTYGPGGGGGFGGPGAAGAGNGGAAYGDLLVKLEGGSGGGIGTGSRDHTTQVYYAGGAGGAGGGAIEISAVGAITISGVINARGNGGQAGQFGFTTQGANGGGGAGGGILLAGASVTLTDSGVLSASPGSGGYQSFDGGGGGRITIQTPRLADFVSSGVIDVLNYTDYGFHDGVVSVDGATGSVSGRVSLEGAANFTAQTITFNVRDASGAPLFDRVLSVSDTGAVSDFQIYGIPAGNYQIRIKSAKNLAQIITGVASGGAVFAGKVTLPGGDANNDNVVDSSDFGILIGAFNSAANLLGSGYDATADFNNDGLVDSTDFGILINNFGMEGAN